MPVFVQKVSCVVEQKAHLDLISSTGPPPRTKEHHASHMRTLSHSHRSNQHSTAGRLVTADTQGRRVEQAAAALRTRTDCTTGCAAQLRSLTAQPPQHCSLLAFAFASLSRPLFYVTKV
jgi:hypothetical protein